MNRYNDFMSEKLFEHAWSTGAINCYKIGCNCAICPIPGILTSGKCRMKATVMGYFLRGINPPKGLRQDILEDYNEKIDKKRI